MADERLEQIMLGLGVSQEEIERVLELELDKCFILGKGFGILLCELMELSPEAKEIGAAYGVRLSRFTF